MMDVALFEVCLDRYGADLSAWPPQLLEEARACLAASIEAQAAHRALLEIETRLRDRPAMSAPASIVARRAMLAERVKRPLLIPRLAWSAAAAAALLVGLFVGSGALNEGSDRATAVAFDTLGPADVD
jgi:hypothetical protein